MSGEQAEKGGILLGGRVLRLTQEKGFTGSTNQPEIYTKMRYNARVGHEKESILFISACGTIHLEKGGPNAGDPHLGAHIQIRLKALPEIANDRDTHETEINHNGYVVCGTRCQINSFSSNISCPFHIEGLWHIGKKSPHKKFDLFLNVKNRAGTYSTLIFERGNDFGPGVFKVMEYATSTAKDIQFFGGHDKNEPWTND